MQEVEYIMSDTFIRVLTKLLNESETEVFERICEIVQPLVDKIRGGQDHSWGTHVIDDAGLRIKYKCNYHRKKRENNSPITIEVSFNPEQGKQRKFTAQDVADILAHKILVLGDE